MDDEKNDLPYNFSMDAAWMIINELPNTPESGGDIDKLFKDAGLAKIGGKSFILRFIQFIDLAETEGNTIRVSKIARSLAFMKEDKTKILAKNLPEPYTMMLKWIKNSEKGELSPREIMAKYSLDLDYAKSKIMLERGITTFIRYASDLGLIDSSGKGRAASYRLTGFGALNLNQQKTAEPVTSISSSKIEPTAITEQTKLPTGTYPIKIIAPDRTPLTIEIHTEADWTAIESFITAIHESWKKKEAENKKKE